MSSRLAIVFGLVSGALVAGGLLAGLVAVNPGRDAPAATPPPQLPSGEPSPASTASTPASAPAGSGAGASSAGPSTGGSASFHIGEPAPVLEVAQLGGGRIDLAALRGKPVWLNFMATWCPTCADEFRQMDSFAARYAEAGLVIVAVDVREDESTVTAFMQTLDPTFPIGLDPSGAARDEWDAYALPVHFWIDRDGVVRAGALGGIGPDVMAESLATILPGVEVAP